MCDGPAGIPAGSPSCRGCLDAAAISRIGVFYPLLSCTPRCNDTALERGFSPVSDGLSLRTEVLETPPIQFVAPKDPLNAAFPPPLPVPTAEFTAGIKVLLPRAGESCFLWENTGLEAARPTSAKFKEQRTFRQGKSRETCGAIPFSCDQSACTIILKLYLMDCFLCPAQLIMF